MYIIELCSLLVLPFTYYLAFHRVRVPCNADVTPISSRSNRAFRRERLRQTPANKMKDVILIDLGLADDDALDQRRLLADRHRQ